MSKFKIGDRVVIVGAANPDCASYIGAFAFVCSELRPFEADGKGYRRGEPVHSIAPDDGRRLVAAPRHIEPLPDDGHEKADLAATPEWIQKLCRGKVTA